MHLRRTRTFSPTTIKPHRGTTTSKKNVVVFSTVLFFKKIQFCSFSLHTASVCVCPAEMAHGSIQSIFFNSVCFFYNLIDFRVKSGSISGGNFQIEFKFIFVSLSETFKGSSALSLLRDLCVTSRLPLITFDFGIIPLVISIITIIIAAAVAATSCWRRRDHNNVSFQRKK